MLVNWYVDWAIELQVGDTPPPGQPPLSRPTDQKASSPMWVALAAAMTASPQSGRDDPNSIVIGFTISTLTPLAFALVSTSVPSAGLRPKSSLCTIRVNRNEVPGRSRCPCARALFIMSMLIDASMSTSMCVMCRVSMTFSYAATSCACEPHTCSRYGPTAPPKATVTSPPIPLMALMSLTMRDSVSGIVPPQDGTQPADDPITKAVVKNR